MLCPEVSAAQPCPHPARSVPVSAECPAACRRGRRGDLPPQPSAATVPDIVFGTLWYRLPATRRAVDGDLLEDLPATLLDTRSPGPAPRTHGEEAP